MSPPTRLCLPLLAALVLGACAQLRGHLPSQWPFQARSVPAPQAVHELDLHVAPDAPMPIVLQFWERNTLVVDLQGVASSGELELTPRSGTSWPVRIAFRAAPGRFESLEVTGAQRVLLPVSGAKGSSPITLPLEPSAYASSTARLHLHWGMADAL